MLTMQAFYTKLWSVKDSQDPLWDGLVRIANLSLTQALAFKSNVNITWSIWS
jgi:hypothetical protein